MTSLSGMYVCNAYKLWFYTELSDVQKYIPMHVATTLTSVVKVRLKNNNQCIMSCNGIMPTTER